MHCCYRLRCTGCCTAVITFKSRWQTKKFDKGWFEGFQSKKSWNSVLWKCHQCMLWIVIYMIRIRTWSPWTKNYEADTRPKVRDIDTEIFLCDYNVFNNICTKFEVCRINKLKVVGYRSLFAHWHQCHNKIFVFLPIVPPIITLLWSHYHCLLQLDMFNILYMIIAHQCNQPCLNKYN